MTVTRATLPQTTRLSGGAHFTGAFERRVAGSCFQLLARPNQTDGLARLGIVVGRRTAPRAVDRARARRVVREEFRKLRSNLGPMDIVIRVKRVIPAATRAEARQEIRTLLLRIGGG